MGSGRGAYYGDYPSTLEYMEHANANVLVMAQLEDVGVLDDLDGILGVEGIDYYSSGPQDIAQSMDCPDSRLIPRCWSSRRRFEMPFTPPGRRWSTTTWSRPGRLT